MKRSQIKHHIDGLLALLVFGVFAACVLAVLLTGARAYRRLTDRDQAAYDERTCMQYVAARIRQADSLEGVAIEEFGDVTALVLGDGGDYVTRVYCCDGYLMELYSDALSEFTPADGERVMEAEEMDLSLSERLLTVTVTGKEGASSTLQLCLRSGERVEKEAAA